MFEDLREDLKRYPGTSSGARLREALREPGFWAVATLRLLHATRGWPRAMRLPVEVLHLAVKLATGIELHPAACFGPGLRIDHLGGIVVSRYAVIGAVCTLSPGVTIGLARREDGRFGAPVIGDRVHVGPGARVIGPIRVGDDVAIGANAVVLHDVPPGVTVGGVPARIVSDRGSRDLIELGRDEAPFVPLTPLRVEFDEGIGDGPPNVVVRAEPIHGWPADGRSEAR